MDTFICEIIDGILNLNEHVDYKWLTVIELSYLDWAAADLPIVKNYVLINNMEALKLAIQNAVTTGFVDDKFVSISDYRPVILTNEPEVMVRSTIIDELRDCQDFSYLLLL